jgi:hypothetical protein
LPSPGKHSAIIQNQINVLGNKFRCHRCRAIDPGTKSGNWVTDPIPPSTLENDEDQFIYPSYNSFSYSQSVLKLLQQLLGAAPIWKFAIIFGALIGKQITLKFGQRDDDLL